MQFRYFKQRPPYGRQRQQTCLGTTLFGKTDQDKSRRQTLADNTGAAATGKDFKQQQSFLYTKPEMVEKLPQEPTNQPVIGDQTFRVLVKEWFPCKKNATNPRGGQQPPMTSPSFSTKKQSKSLPDNSGKKRTKTKLKKPALWQEPGVPSFIFFSDETSVVSSPSCVSTPKDTNDKLKKFTADAERGSPCSIIAVLHHLDNACSVLTTSVDGSSHHDDEKQEEVGDNLADYFVPRDYSPITVGDDECF